MNHFCAKMAMTINTDNKKVVIIKSKKISYNNFIHDNNKLEEVSSCKYLRNHIHHKINWNYSIEKMINGGLRAYFGFENNYKSTHLVMLDKNNFLFEILVTSIILYGYAIWGCNISKES